MALNSESGNTVLRLWLLLHRVRDGIVLCEDSVFGNYGLTTEQFSVLAAVKSRGGSLKPSELATILARRPNSVTMLVDRMVKAGWVKRTRDRKDRRGVNVSLTSKGEKGLEPAGPAGWEFIQKILSPLSYKDKQALTSMLEVLKCEVDGYLNPEADMTEIIKNSYTKQPGLYERMVKNIFPSGSEAKHKGGKKGKTIR
ncbi:MAG: MarR family transcriptional regulator [Dehalococcoidia bacterium]|nr:MarR family transcriptional regulator [Dehalococcoidia bacterium]MDH4291851.1 MarR family transcriptional regulator [Dehalococcoidia bacterium]